MSDLLSEIEELQFETEEVESELDDYLRRRHAKDQSIIAWVIIGAFVLAIAGIFATVFFYGSGTNCTPEPCWKAPAEFLTETVSAVLLPIVTLVLGYYFGSEHSKRG